MAKNTNNDYRNGSVNDRIQVCDQDTGVCKKIDTNTGEIISQKDGSYKGVANHTDNRRNDDFNDFINDLIKE